MLMDVKYNDGGRALAGYTGRTGDCVTRAIAIATGRPYQEVYDAFVALAKDEKKLKGMKRSSHPRTGVYKHTRRRFIQEFLHDWEWVPTMFIGQGCKVHLRRGELPMGRLIVSCSKHLVAVIDGVIHDTFDPSRQGTRCVYGYYRRKA